jgi:hypothetical protein
MDDLNRVRELAGLQLLESHVSSAIESAEVVEEETTEEEAVGEAGGYYTKGVWKLIDAHGADAVLREMLRFLHADVIQDFTNHMHDADAMSFESAANEGETRPKFVFTVINSNTLLIVNDNTGEQRYANNVTLPSLYDVTQAQLAKLFKTGTHSDAK